MECKEVWSNLAITAGCEKSNILRINEPGSNTHRIILSQRCVTNDYDKMAREKEKPLSLKLNSKTSPIFGSLI
jgi:hypothetical protein